MIDFKLLRAARGVQKKPKSYFFSPEVAAAELDFFLDKYQITDEHDMAVMMAAVLHFDPHFYDAL